jgi:hypothetical protein
MWYRVFGKLVKECPPEVISDALQNAGHPVRLDFKGDDLGWSSLAVTFSDRDETPIMVERYITAEDDIRDDLNTWAGWLESATYSAKAKELMEPVIQAAEMITLRKPIDHANDARLNNLCEQLSQLFAQTTLGMYQVDGLGFFDATGTLLVEEY